jgi:hypothetical protein
VQLSSAGSEELALAYARLSCVEDELLGALNSEERVMLYDVLCRAVGVSSPPCDASEQSPPGCDPPRSGIEDPSDLAETTGSHAATRRQ